jgi:hypothetical protein
VSFQRVLFSPCDAPCILGKKEKELMGIILFKMPTGITEYVARQPCNYTSKNHACFCSQLSFTTA